MEFKEIQEELEDVLDQQFPKHKCKERGNALVLFVMMWREIAKLEGQRRYWERRFKELEKEKEDKK